MIIQKKAHAKINLYLKILDKLPNGYHNIFTVMQKISLCDNIKININQSETQNINIICENKNIPDDKTNTAYKAAQLFLEYTKIISDISIKIEKKIPSQAGLGGGSSDAASVLSGLNEYYNFILSKKELLEISAKIGADVPFFVSEANCAVCEGIGEIITPINIDLSDFYCLIVKPVYNISTKQAYEDFDKFINSKHQNNTDITKYIHNDFSNLIFSQNNNIKEIKDLLIKSNAAAAELSGSGSAVFGIFNNLKTSKKCEAIINQRPDIEFCGIFEFNK